MGSGKRHTSFSSTESHHSGASSLFSSGARSAWSSATAGTSYSAATVASGVPQIAHIPRTLPCEFVGYGECQLTFDFDDVERWIEHIIGAHLHDRLPKRALCWFCDDYVFDYKDQYANGDRRVNYDNRMNHIREHIVYEGKTLADIRPDHDFNAHLNDNELISTNAYNGVRRWSEAPIGPWLYAHDAVPYEMEVQAERRQRQYINPHDADRKEKRRERHGRR
ncbi:hypothetical protein GGR57DRAFT_246557 [Xylariaceae sp. FL1272]|nr:hypothetical protein GGR57DRAFT_246557 [Xylariaceae sp. FL1272]